MNLEFIEKAKIELMYKKGNVDRKIYKYEDKAIFKHVGSWHFCKKIEGEWKHYEIRNSQYRILKPQI